MTLRGRFEEAVGVLQKCGGPALAEARGRAAVARTAGARLARGQRILRIERLSGEGWMVLSAKEARDGDRVTYSAIMVEVMERGRVAWSHSLKDPRDLDEASVVNLAIIPGATPQVLVSSLLMGASWAPSYLEIYRGKGGPLTTVLTLTSHEPLEVSSRQGVWTVRNRFAIGIRPCHAEQPRWGDIYQYDAKAQRWQEVDQAYPGDFKEVRSQIEERLKTYPDDWDLLKYLGKAREIGGNKPAAIEAYRKALEAARQAVPDEAQAAARAIPEIQARLKSLGG